MREVTYRWYEHDSKDVETFDATLIEFVYNVVAITESGIVPPLSILNERFLSGGKCNPFGNVEWAPFEIGEDEYAQLIDVLEAQDAATVWSHKGINFVKLKRAEELDKFVDSLHWSKAVHKSYSDEYIAKLMELNSQKVDDFPSHDGHPTEVTQAEEGNEGPDLVQIRKVLFELCSAAVKRFADENQDKRFYAFGLDLNVTYGDVLLCANTELDYEETAARYVRDLGYTEDRLTDLKNNFGDWRYQGFNLDYEDWNTQWGPFRSAIDRYVHATDSEEEVSKFMDELIKVSSFVLLDLNEHGLLKLLNREPGFYIKCLDHDEDEDEAERRFDRYRREHASA